jgi:hypothetical protein
LTSSRRHCAAIPASSPACRRGHPLPSSAAVAVHPLPPSRASRGPLPSFAAVAASASFAHRGSAPCSAPPPPPSYLRRPLAVTGSAPCSAPSPDLRRPPHFCVVRLRPALRRHHFCVVCLIQICALAASASSAYALHRHRRLGQGSWILAGRAADLHYRCRRCFCAGGCHCGQSRGGLDYLQQGDSRCPSRLPLPRIFVNSSKSGFCQLRLLWFVWFH